MLYHLIDASVLQHGPTSRVAGFIYGEIQRHADTDNGFREHRVGQVVADFRPRKADRPLGQWSLKASHRLMWGIHLVAVREEVVVREQGVAVEFHPLGVAYTHLAAGRIPHLVADRIHRPVADDTHPMVLVVHNFPPPPKEKQSWRLFRSPTSFRPVDSRMSDFEFFPPQIHACWYALD
ncbi:MAG: hypothetical protein OXI44_00110 [Bacteroidota bacterium]|nr:hypothetical protein [Bacteroidota bacterium]